jgi:transcriptional regulator with XRE-family HTH domain
MTFYEKVYETAKTRGLSIKQLAEKIHVSDATIYTWKRTGAPTGKNLTAVAEELGVSVDYLLGNSDDMHGTRPDDGPLNLLEVIDDSERDEMISANGQRIDDEDWAVIKALLAKYPKRD